MRTFLFLSNSFNWYLFRTASSTKLPFSHLIFGFTTLHVSSSLFLVLTFFVFLQHQDLAMFVVLSEESRLFRTSFFNEAAPSFYWSSMRGRRESCFYPSSCFASARSAHMKIAGQRLRTERGICDSLCRHACHEDPAFAGILVVLHDNDTHSGHVHMSSRSSFGNVPQGILSPLRRRDRHVSTIHNTICSRVHLHWRSNDRPN